MSCRLWFLPLCFALLCGLADRGVAKNPRKQLQQIEELLDQGSIDQAEQLLVSLQRRTPDHPRVIQLQAELYFLQGQYAKAAQWVNKAGNKNRGSPKLKALRQLIKATREAVKGFKEHRSPGGHFSIWTPPGKDEILAVFIGETLEKTQRALQESLAFQPQDTIRVELYAKPEVLAQVSPLSIQDIRRSGAIALSKYNRLMLVTPRALLRGYPWLDAVAHEYVHLAISRLTRDNTPVWLQEGLAKYFEATWRLPSETAPPLSPAQEHLLLHALLKGRLLRWEEMHPSMAKLSSQQEIALAFAQAQTAIEFVAKSSGLQALRRMMQALRAGKTDWQALEAAVHLDRKRFDASWKKYLRSLNLRRLSGIVPPQLEFGPTPSEEKKIAAIKENRARKYLQLANLLRARGLTQAAIIEYQKAREVLGPRHELVANSLARAYLEISSPAQAISTLLPVLEYYPEYPGPQVTIGVAYLRSGDLYAAERHLKTALRLNPFDPEIHCGLSQALQQRATRESDRYTRLCARLRN